MTANEIIINMPKIDRMISDIETDQCCNPVYFEDENENVKLLYYEESDYSFRQRVKKIIESLR